VGGKVSKWMEKLRGDPSTEGGGKIAPNKTRNLNRVESLTRGYAETPDNLTEKKKDLRRLLGKEIWHPTG